MSKPFLTLQITDFQGENFYSENVTKLIVPTKAGQITILPGHIDICASLIKGEINIFAPDQKTFQINGGFIQLTENSQIDILTEQLLFS